MPTGHGLAMSVLRTMRLGDGQTEEGGLADPARGAWGANEVDPCGTNDPEAKKSKDLVGALRSLDGLGQVKGVEGR